MVEVQALVSNVTRFEQTQNKKIQCLIIQTNEPREPRISANADETTTTIPEQNNTTLENP